MDRPDGALGVAGNRLISDTNPLRLAREKALEHSEAIRVARLAHDLRFPA
jgi:hypothetical protein